MLKIYLVDDDFWILTELENIIDYKEYGFEIVGRSTFGAEALKEIQILKPNLVITDIQMDDVNGLDLVKILKETNKDLFYIFLSGYDKFDYAVEAVKLGAFRYLKKPIKKDELITCLLEIKNKIYNNFVLKLVHAIENNSYKSVVLLEENNIIEKAPYRVVVFNGNNSKEKVINLNVGTSNVQIYSDDLINIFIVFNLDKNKLYDFYNNNKDDLSICYTEEMPKGDFKSIIDLVRKTRINSKQKFILGENCIIEYHQQTVQEILKSIDAINKISLLENYILNLKSFLIENKIFVSNLQSIYKHILFAMIKMNIIDFDDTMIDLSIIDTYQSIDEFIHELDSYFHKEKYVDEKEIIIDEVIKEIENNLSEKISLSYMADKYKYNISYFSQLFKKTVGVSFVEYVINLKIDRAKYMIINTNEQLQIIAYNLGYDDYYHFSKIFKKYTSYSPSEYRNIFKKN